MKKFIKTLRITLPLAALAIVVGVVLTGAGSQDILEADSCRTTVQERCNDHGFVVDEYNAHRIGIKSGLLSTKYDAYRVKGGPFEKMPLSERPIMITDEVLDKFPELGQFTYP